MPHRTVCWHRTRACLAARHFDGRRGRVERASDVTSGSDPGSWLLQLKSVSHTDRIRTRFRKCKSAANQEHRTCMAASCFLGFFLISAYSAFFPLWLSLPSAGPSAALTTEKLGLGISDSACGDIDVVGSREGGDDANVTQRTEGR